MKNLIVLLLLICFAISCEPDQQSKTDTVDRIINRLVSDPDRINPLLTATSRSREVYSYLMLPMMDVNPVTLDIEPLLITEAPEAVDITEGEYKGLKKYTFEFLSDATWSDGSDITAEDFIFTMKLVYHKGLNLVGWKKVYSSIIETIIPDESNPKQFDVIVKKADETSFVYLCGIEVYPRKFYDPENKLGAYSLDQLLDDENYDSLVKADMNLALFATEFQSPKYSREVVEGAGPYQLTAWEDGQYLRIQKKENFWGEKYPERMQLNGYAQEIIFQIIEDDVTVINQLDGENIHVTALQSTSGDKFSDLKNDPIVSENYNFYTPQLMRYLCIQLNNENPLLSDIRVRKALSHVVDVDRLINVGEAGLGKRVSSIFMESRPYYNDNLTPVPYNLEEAKKLLSEAGWTDTNGNGTIDKVINGERMEMKLRLHGTSSALSQRVALNIKEGASQVGIDIELITQSFRVTLPKNLKTGDYELTPMMATLSPIDIPFRKWHSSEIGGQGQNTTRFSNKKADQLLEKLEKTSDEAARNKLLYDIQQVIYDEYPIIMLYAPVEKIVVSKEFDPLISSKRPGYFLNLFKSKSE